MYRVMGLTAGQRHGWVNLALDTNLYYLRLSLRLDLDWKLWQRIQRSPKLSPNGINDGTMLAHQAKEHINTRGCCGIQEPLSRCRRETSAKYVFPASLATKTGVPCVWMSLLQSREGSISLIISESLAVPWIWYRSDIDVSVYVTILFLSVRDHSYI